MGLHTPSPQRDSSKHEGIVFQGGNLVFSTREQPVPEQLQAHPTITFRVTDVDDEAKAEIL